MKPQEKKLVDNKAKVFDNQKIKDQIMIVRSLNETQAQSTIENLSTTLKMVHEIDVLDQLGGLSLNDFYKEIKLNRLEDLKFKDSKLYNVYCKAFCDFALIPNLEYSKQDLEDNYPYRYIGLRKVSEICIANKMYKFIHYGFKTEIVMVGNKAIEKEAKDSNGQFIRDCFTEPSSDKPIEIYIKSSLINSNAKLKKRLNPKGQTPFVPLSFEKLKDFANFLLAGDSSRVSSSSEKDKTLSASAKKVDELRQDLISNVVFTPINFKLPKESAERINQEASRVRESENLIFLVSSIIEKLIKGAEFEALLKVYLTIATNKNFVKFIKDNYKANVAAFVEEFGGQWNAVDLDTLDLTNQIQIDTRLNRIQEKTVKPNKQKQIVNKK
jgi:hypothetical protein